MQTPSSNAHTFRLVAFCGLTAAIILTIEWGRTSGFAVPIPFLLLYVCVVSAGGFAGRVAGTLSGLLAAAFVVYAHTISFGPTTLTGGGIETLLGGLLYSGSGLFFGHIYDQRQEAYRRQADHEAALEDEVHARTRAFAESEARFRDFAEASSDYFWEMDEKLRFSAFSERFTDVTGLEKEQLLGKTREEVGIPNVDPDAWRQHLDDLANHRPFQNFVFPRTMPDGAVVWLSANGVPVFDGSGRFTGYRGTGRDITRRVLADQAFAESENRFRDFAEIASDWLWETDADMRFTYFSQRNREVTGFDPNAYIGQSRFDVAADVADDPKWREHRETLERREPFRDFEYTLMNSDGNRLTLCVSGVPVFDRNGVFTGYRGVGRNVTEQKRSEEALAQALHDTEAANRAKSNLLATMSHELRTPLNAILGFSDVLRQELFGAIGSPQYKDYAEDIHSSGEHLLALINDILDLSAIEAGRREFNKSLFPIAEVLEDCARTFAPMSEAKRIAIVFDNRDQALSVHADRRSVVQILNNLLSNALKFTPADGTIRVHAEQDHDTVVITVSDTGCGIPEEALPKITEPFAQLDNDPMRTQEGTGLGLSIVKFLVEAHHGEMHIDSTVGKGTSVRISLPADNASEAPLRQAI